MLVPSVCVPSERLRVNNKFHTLGASDEGEFFIHRRGAYLLDVLLHLSPPSWFAFSRERRDDGWIVGLLDRNLGVDMPAVSERRQVLGEQQGQPCAGRHVSEQLSISGTSGYTVATCTALTLESACRFESVIFLQRINKKLFLLLIGRKVLSLLIYAFFIYFFLNSFKYYFYFEQQGTWSLLNKPLDQFPLRT